MAPRRGRPPEPKEIKAIADRAEGKAPGADERAPLLGRPPSYQPPYAEQAAKLCKLGATDLDLADFFGVSVRTIYRWKLDYPDFCQALKSGKDEADDRVERSLYHKAVGYTHDAVKIFQYEGAPVTVPYREHVAPDTTAAIFWLKNRRPAEWRDVSKIEHTGKDGAAIEYADVSARDVIERRVAGLAARSEVEGNPRKPH